MNLNAIRCAIYTRKSTEEGLEQNFNSLDAQREACAAFIASQRHEGWTASGDIYEDGGCSGGTMNRPGLQKLFEDIKAGKINTIVVYKIDRLTRSLADFAKMVELFDQHKVTFVSVTQQFNTTTSMGRLTLNVLLSFAQFEREVTGERIRDKVAASKAKGMWMGGTVPLGYQVENRQLIIQPTEAELVRRIFQQYVVLGSVHRLREQLRAQGHRTRNGGHFFTGMLANMLTNPVYIGRVRHKDKTYVGNHKPIIVMELWEQVQAMRKESNRQHRHKYRALERSLLAGKIHDAEGHPMSCVHAQKLGRRYRYYVSQGMLQGRPLLDTTVTRIPAGELEEVVSTSVKQILHNDDLLSQINPELSLLNRRRAQELANGWDKIPALQKHVTIRTVLSRISVHCDHIKVSVSKAGLLAVLEGESHDTELADDDFSHLIPIKLKPVEGGATYIIGEVEPSRPPNMELVRAVARACIGNRMLVNREVSGQAELAKQFGIDKRRLREILPLAWLAPEIVEMILIGRQPQNITIEKLMGISGLEDWQAQIQAVHQYSIKA